MPDKEPIVEQDKYAIVNITKLEAVITAEADALRDKLGLNHETLLNYDFDKESGYADLIREFPKPEVGFQPTAWDRIGYPVAGKLWGMNDIPGQYFYGSQFTELQSVSIAGIDVEDGTIGIEAFSGCPLTSFDFSAGSSGTGFTDIGDRAFCGTGLTMVTLPATIESVSNSAFDKCDDITDIYCCWVEGEKPRVEAAAPWGAVNATIHYNDPNLLMFTSDQPFSVSIAGGLPAWGGTIEYSTDRSNWAIWQNVDYSHRLNSGAHQLYKNVLYFRGSNNVKIAGSMNHTWDIEGDGTYIDCSGNIEGLLDYSAAQAGQHPAMDTDCFKAMFRNCTKLISAPNMPAVTLSDGCYESMFEGCSSLVNPPILPATQMARRCYALMFKNCTSLVTAPALPCTYSDVSCYEQMFYGCTSLVNPPDLMCESVSASAYMRMFYGCTSLVTPPRIGFSTLINTTCCSYMFANCVSLAALPKLNALSINNGCYSNMFNGCTSIKLSTTQSNDYRYEYRIPTTGTGRVYGSGSSNGLYSMFTGTGGTFTGTPAVNTTYYTTNPPIGEKE